MGGKKEGTLSRSEEEGLPFCVRIKESGKEKKMSQKISVGMGYQGCWKYKAKGLEKGGGRTIHKKKRVW